MTKRMTFYKPQAPYYMDDVQKIVDGAALHDIVITHRDAELAWLAHSEDHCAGWLFLPDTPEEAWSIVGDHFFSEVDEK